MKNDFPLPFPYLRAEEGRAGETSTSFLVAAMFTPDYAGRAERLRNSCQRFDVPYALYEIAAIHHSVSAKGGNDLRFTKPNFVAFALGRYRKPILYVDADCVFCAYPDLIEQLLPRGIMFAVYNWAADLHNDTFAPMTTELNEISDRYYGHSLRVNRYAPTQLLCNGSVQLYTHSPATKALLEMWQATVQRFPGTAVDDCLDFAFNNGGSRIPGLSVSWLPKEYARIRNWIYVKPVINHPDRVSPPAHKPIPETPTERRFFADQAMITQDNFPENCVFDVKERLLYRLIDDKLTLIGPTDYEFWVD